MFLARSNHSYRQRTAFIYLGLTIVTAAVYWPVRHFEFTNYDDPVYVTENPHVQDGLTTQAIGWAFTTSHFSIWAPVMWLSCMLDCQMFGLNAGPHHVVNALLHLASTLLLFGVFCRMTRAPWRSAFMAALFALHPLHVESVAWVAERKDVLSALFWMLTMVAYVWYVESPGAGRYLLTVGLYAVGLMAKPMLVTLPFVLLLLDYWPLKRTSSVCSLIVEKLPLFALTMAVCSVTYWAEQRGGAIADSLPLAPRVANAIVSYLRYLGKLFWPVDLAAYYPRQTWSTPIVLGAAVILVVITLLVFWQTKQRPFLFTGWLWYLGTLVPVIGLVQVGSFSMADRYTYIPLIGAFIMLGWFVPSVEEKNRTVRAIAGAWGGAALLACFALSCIQIGYWKNSETLFRHALAVTENNAVAHENLGKSLAEHGDLAGATAEFTRALRINPNSAFVHVDLGGAFATRGNLPQALTEFTAALHLKPDFAPAHYNLGVALAASGRASAAVIEFTEAVRLDPDYAEAHFNLGALMERAGQILDTVREYRKAVRLRPNWPLALRQLAWILATNPDAGVRNGDEAVRLAERLCRVTNYQQAGALDVLAAAYAERGRFNDASRVAQQATFLATASGHPDIADRIRARLKLYETGQSYHGN